MKLPHLQHFRPNTWAPAWVLWLVIANGLCNCSFCRRLVDLHDLQWMPCWMVPKLSGNRVLKPWGATFFFFLADFFVFVKSFDGKITPLPPFIHSFWKCLGKKHVQGAPPKEFVSGMKKPCWIKPKPSSFAFSSLTRRKEKSQELCFLSPLPWHHHFQLPVGYGPSPTMGAGKSAPRHPSFGRGKPGWWEDVSKKNGPVFSNRRYSRGQFIKVFSYPGLLFLEASNCNRKCHLDAFRGSACCVWKHFIGFSLHKSAVKIHWLRKTNIWPEFQGGPANATPPRVLTTTLYLEAGIARYS